jgi:hypothetical protein
MTKSGLLFVIYALCTYRLVVLVVDDTILNPFRMWVMRQRSKWLKTLIQCYWCVSVWLAAGVVLLARFGGSWAVYPCAALAISAIAGYLGERE